jgi:hypothetical protein
MTEAQQKRLRFWAGLVFGALAAVAMVVGMWRDQPVVMVGGFLGGMVAGNVIPFADIKSVIPWGRP